MLGSDGAGIVDRVGSAVTGRAPGEPVALNPGLWDGTCDACRAGDEALCRSYRILGEHTQGTAAPFVVLPARNVHPLPPSMSFAQAAAAPLVFLTAWRALRTVGQLAVGERVAIIGAGGGVATAAVQVARLLGGTVAVASRSPQKEAAARSLGAEAFVAFDGDHPLDRGLWQWSEKRGVDLILDSVGAPTLARAVRALARGGRIVTIGATAGATVELDVRTVFWRQASIRGSTMSGDREFREVWGHLASGRLHPVIDTDLPFDRAPEAFRRLEAPDLFGKVVLSLPS